MRSEVTLFINGNEHQVSGADAFLPLSTWLRQVQFSIGTKVVCEEGDCGACTVLVGRSEAGSLSYIPVNSCILIVAQLDGAHVITVEGVGRDGQLSTIQQRMIEYQGAQCGYCTPGFIVAMTALAQQRDEWTAREVRDSLTGNLCRCTGYAPIIEAALAASGSAGPTMNELYPAEPIVRSLTERAKDDLVVEAPEQRFFAPSTLNAALRIKAEYPDVRILQGGTDLGVLRNKRGLAPRNLMSLMHVEGLGAIGKQDNTLTIGANVTLSELERQVKPVIPELYRLLTLFGSPQIRNAGTVAGNIANGSPIGDLLPFLLVAGAAIELASVRGSRLVNLNEFYKGYKKFDMLPDELITRVMIPIPGERETLKLYKVSKRRDLDISSFAAALRMQIDNRRMSSVKIAFGGVAPTVIRVPQVERLLEGKEFSLELLQMAGEEARKAIAPISDVRGSAEFRSQLAQNIFEKFYWDVAGEPSLATMGR